MFDDEGEEPEAADDFAPPPPPDDRLWRHPSELAAASQSAIVTQPIEQSSVGRMFGVAGLSALGGGLIVAGLWITLGSLNPTDQVAIERIALPEVTIEEPADGTQLIVAADEWPSTVAEAVEGAIVVVGPTDGLGVVTRGDGYLVAAASVVPEAGPVDVGLPDGSTADGEVVAVDTLTGLAVVELNDAELAPAVIDVGDPPELGDRAVALIGPEPGTDAIAGSVVATQVRFDAPDGPFHGLIELEPDDGTGLQLGAAVLDARGAVVGLITQVDESEGRAYVTPIAVARRLTNAIADTGSITHAWLGVQGSDADPTATAEHELTGAALVQAVVADSPAAECGLTQGDLIITADGMSVANMSGLVGTVLAMKPGDRLSLEYLRDDGTASCTIELAPRP